MSSEIETGFIRQRRNLILITVVLSFIEGADVSLSKINILGNELSIDDPAIVTLALWIALAYWYARYYQYFRDLPHRYIRSAYQKHLDYYVVIAAFQNASKFVSITDIAPDLTGKTRITRGSDELIERRTWLYRFNLKVAVETQENGREWHVVATHDLQDVKLQGRKLLVPKFRAAWHVLANTRMFTEYLMPYILPLIPIAIKVHKHYPI